MRVTGIAWYSIAMESMQREKPYRRPPERCDDLRGDREVSVSSSTWRRLHDKSRETGMSMHKLVIMSCAREILIGGAK